MLCFPQMATKAQISAEQYLDMTFEYDAEFVHGEIVDRSFPDLSHSTAQAAVCWRFAELERRLRLLPWRGVRMKLGEGLALADYPFELTPDILFSDL